MVRTPRLGVLLDPRGEALKRHGNGNDELPCFLHDHHRTYSTQHRRGAQPRTTVIAGTSLAALCGWPGVLYDMRQGKTKPSPKGMLSPAHSAHHTTHTYTPPASTPKQPQAASSFALALCLVTHALNPALYTRPITHPPTHSTLPFSHGRRHDKRHHGRSAQQGMLDLWGQPRGRRLPASRLH